MQVVDVLEGRALPVPGITRPPNPKIVLDFFDQTAQTRSIPRTSNPSFQTRAVFRIPSLLPPSSTGATWPDLPALRVHRLEKCLFPNLITNLPRHQAGDCPFVPKSVVGPFSGRLCPSRTQLTARVRSSGGIRRHLGGYGALVSFTLFAVSCRCNLHFLFGVGFLSCRLRKCADGEDRACSKIHQSYYFGWVLVVGVRGSVLLLSSK